MPVLLALSRLLGVAVVLYGVAAVVGLVIALTAGTVVFSGSVNTLLAASLPDGTPASFALYSDREGEVYLPDAQGNYHLEGRFMNETGSIFSVLFGALDDPRRIEVAFYEAPGRHGRHAIQLELDGFDAAKAHALSPKTRKLIRQVSVQQVRVAATGEVNRGSGRPIFGGHLRLSAVFARAASPAR